MSDPRVLITTYHQAYTLKGGGEFEIFSVADSLKQRGIIADIYGPYSRDLDNYDVVLHFSVHGGGLQLLRDIHRAGKPVILWPNLWVRDIDAVPAELVEAHVALATAVIFKSAAEEKHFAERFNLPLAKTRRVSAGADSAYRRPAPKGLFKSLYDVDRYAIWFGVIEPNKNQLAAIRVLRQKNIHLVLVGRSREEEYDTLCRAVAGTGVTFIKGLPQKSEIVRSALQEALFYIEVSHEPPGLSAIEAGLSGCKLLLSDSSWSREHFGANAIYADANDDGSISRAVDEILIREVDRPSLIASLDKFSLPQAIDPLVDILRMVV